MFEHWPQWARWAGWVGGTLVLASLLRPRSAQAAPKGKGGMGQAELDAKYGPLRPGVDYAEGKGGRIVPVKGWAAARMVKVRLFDGKTVTVHRLIADNFARTYEEAVRESGYHPKSVQTWVPRHILWNPKNRLSLHSYGIAVDFDPSLNPYGDRPAVLDRYPKFVEVFERNGWRWGGRWKPASRDKMHFERRT